MLSHSLHFKSYVVTPVHSSASCGHARCRHHGMSCVTALRATQHHVSSAHEVSDPPQCCARPLCFPQKQGRQEHFDFHSGLGCVQANDQSDQPRPALVPKPQNQPNKKTLKHCWEYSCIIERGSKFVNKSDKAPTAKAFGGLNLYLSAQSTRLLL